MNSKKILLNRIFSILNQFASYAVLRNYENLPDTPSRDIDILIDRKDYRRIRFLLLEAAKELQFSLLQIYKGHEMHSLVLAKVSGTDIDMISLDFLFSIYVKGTVLIPAKKILATRIYNGKLYHVRSDYEFLSKFLYNTLLGEDYPEKYNTLREHACIDYKQSITDELIRIFGKRVRQPDDLKKESHRKMMKIAKRRVFFQYPGEQTISRFRYVASTLRNLLFPEGFSLGFTGPDGSGKTTVITLLTENLSQIYKKIELHHFRPTLLSNIGDKAQSLGMKKEVDRNYDNPHRGGKTGIVSSLLRLLYYSLDYIAGYYKSIRVKLFQRNLVIFDRYYTDIICDSRRSRIYLNPKFLYRFGCMFIPSLDYNILLTADTDTILARKQELDRESIEAINLRINYLANKKGYYKIMNEGTPQEAVIKILQIVFEKQHEKNLKSLKIK